MDRAKLLDTGKISVQLRSRHILDNGPALGRAKYRKRKDKLFRTRDDEKKSGNHRKPEIGRKKTDMGKPRETDTGI